jgi:hypothetical protein
MLDREQPAKAARTAIKINAVESTARSTFAAAATPCREHAVPHQEQSDLMSADSELPRQVAAELSIAGLEAIARFRT